MLADDRDDRALVYERESSSDVPTAPLGDGFTRPNRDVTFARAFYAALAVTVVCGMFASGGADDRFRELTSAETLNAFGSCHDARGAGVARRRMLEVSGGDSDANVGVGMEMARPYVIASALGAIAIGVGALHAFRAHPRAATWGLIYAKVAMLGGMAILLLAQGSLVGGIFFGLFAAFLLWWMRATSDRVELVAKLLGAASSALRDNPHLITTSLFAGLGVIVMLFVFLVCVVFAYMNGAIVPNYMATHNANGLCYSGPPGDAMTEQVRCCDWQPDSWVAPYVTLVLLVALWTQMIAAEMRTFVVGGAIGRWYFAPVGTRSFAGTTREFVSHAFGASFGSLAFGGLVLTGVQILRNLNERLRRESRGAMAILACIVTAIMDCVAELVETVTKFATIQCALTGEALCDAGREVTRLLKDNFLSAVRVWWLPEMLLNTAAFLTALFYGATVGIVVDIGDRVPQQTAIVVGLIAGVSTLAILGFLFSVLLTCIDAVFICYARDKDANTITKPEVVQIYDEVTEKTRPPELSAQAAQMARRRPAPTTAPGVGVQQPNAPMMYGRPDMV